jgi:hypothetical protein
MTDNLPLSEQFRIVAKKWVDAEAAASIYEDTKSAILSQLMMKHGDMPVSRAEMIVKASEEWDAHVRAIVQSRKDANLLKVHMEYLRMKSGEWQSHEATKRAEMKL